MANPMYGQNKADNALDKVGSEVMVVTAAKTLAASDSGSTVFVNAAAIAVTLPSCAAGLKYKVVFGIDTTAGAKVNAASGDCFFGTLNVNSTTKEKCSAQSIAHATAIAAPGSYDVLDFTHDSQTLAGKAGDMIEIIGIDDISWLVSGALVTDGNDPDAVAIINAS